MRIYRLENVVQPYAWGSTTALTDLLGRPNPGRQPQAELWMGTHPNGPSLVLADGERIPLRQLIARHPIEVLGVDVFSRFGAALPYLFKVLAAARPLSIQAHPSKQQALEGFARETRQGKALDAPDRSYRDDNHKPEVICALTPFWAMNGFRSPAAAADLLSPVCPPVLDAALQDLKASKGEGLRSFFRAMMKIPVHKRRPAVRQILKSAMSRADASPVYRWMVELVRAYPADMGVLAPALLNLVRLEPGRAMYLPAGQLHAYLEGVGIELMANSDNVLRGGLTPKHVDVAELLDVVRFEAATPTVLDAEPLGPAESVFDCPAEEFSLRIIRVAPGREYFAPARRSVELLLCTAGRGRVRSGNQGEMDIRKGDSLLVPAAVDGYAVSGELTVYKAAVPQSLFEKTV
jgi:mannose-6-phosphate isomerase